MHISQNSKLLAVAVLFGTIGLAAPAAGDQVGRVVAGLNADKVDGLHAVRAGATVAKRKGRLVATNKSGRLPNNIIKKANDADRLDGRDSAAYARLSEPLVLTEARPWHVVVGTAYDSGSLSTGASRGGTNGQLVLDQSLTMPVTVFGRAAALVKVEVCYYAPVAAGNDPQPSLKIRVSDRKQDTGVFANSELKFEKLGLPTFSSCQTAAPATPFVPKPGHPLVVELSTNNVSGGSSIIGGRVTSTWVVK